MTNQILTITASILPEEMLIMMLEEAIKEYHDTPEDKERLPKLSMRCALVMTRASIEMSGGDPFKFLQDMEQLESARNIFNPGKQ